MQGDDRDSQDDLFPDVVMPRRYKEELDCSEESGEGALLWPVGEIVSDLKGVERMLSYLKEVTPANKRMSTINYFTYKYGEQRGLQCFALFKKLSLYLFEYGSEMHAYGLIHDEGSIDEPFLEELLKAFSDGGK